MGKYLLSILFVAMILLIKQPEVYGQAQIDTISLEKGEIFDVLIISQNPDTKADLQSYFQTVFPVGKRMSYQPLPSFKILEHVQGNHRPENLILAQWSDIGNRRKFLDQILNEVPDFHERRRTIWSYFGSIYFELQEDLFFEIDRNQYHVCTTYWLDSKGKSSKFYKKWEKAIQKMDGEILVQLSNGESPFAYRYAPDCFVITAWKSEAAFRVFQEKMQQMTMDNIEHINEFILK